MLFNSIDFAIFLPLVFVLYWFVFNGNLKLQNAFLLVASYVFYGWWDWRFLGLILASSLLDYAVGLGLGRVSGRRLRKLLLAVSVSLNIGLLGFFKYYNFFAESLADAFTLFGLHVAPERLNIILPVGISFYTFQVLSYTIDVYRRNIEPTKDLVAFLGFISFFPQLVAGPIERAANLLPQFVQRRQFDYDKAVDGMRQCLWGLFKKMVIADNCATYANAIFDNPGTYSGSTLLLGAVFFAFQIYGDFSGYSDIATGSARLFGFHLMRNFNFPYFSRDIAEFWRRWHISLSTWFRDYVYIPLGGSAGTMGARIRNTFIIFLVSGFWHGANWTFIAWGLINALYFMPLMLLSRNRSNIGTVAVGRLIPTVKEFLQMVVTFFLTLLAWIFFRSENLTQAFHYIAGIFSQALFRLPEVRPVNVLLLLMGFIAIEWVQREKQHALQSFGPGLPRFVRWAVYYGILILIFQYGGDKQEFIYFQF
jgi:alginate O-acetyltransferase complex protein AlgI